MTRKGTRGLGRPGDLLPVGCALLALWTAAVPGQGAVINLTDTTIDSHSQSVTNLHEGTDPFVGGIIGETVFRRPTAIDPRNSGSGVYRDLYRIQDSPTTATEPENGYNRDGVMDSAVPNGFNPFIRYSNLVEDSSHQYFVFSLDINENKGANNEYLSLDAFRIYCGGSTDPNPLPTSVGALGDLAGMTTLDATGALLDSSVYRYTTAASGQSTCADPGSFGTVTTTHAPSVAATASRSP